LNSRRKNCTYLKGNYDQYRKQNTTQTLSSVKLYQDQLNRLKEAKKRLEWGRKMRAKSKEWKVRFDHWLKDYEKIKAETIKPSFWIDQESTENLDKKVTDSYHKFKEKNIAIAINAHKDRVNSLVTVRDLSLGYESPVFLPFIFLYEKY
jgi:ATPase subunit of ABC transporter with duplicated ATPase domains